MGSLSISKKKTPERRETQANIFFPSCGWPSESPPHAKTNNNNIGSMGIRLRNLSQMPSLNLSVE